MRRGHQIAVAGSLAAVLGVILPLQTYLANATVFPFSLARLLPELLGFFVIFSVGALAIACAIGKVGKRGKGTALFFALLTGALVAVYLESGVLSVGLPELNGGTVPELANRTRGGVDAGIWVLLLAGFLVFARRLAAYLHWIAFAVVVLSLAALVDGTARSSSAPCQAEAGGTLSYQAQPTVVANVKYSSARNIFVFVLDSLPGQVTVDILATNAALRAKFPGFTAYPRNIGMHECTKRGVPGLVTGRHFDPAAMSEADYPMAMYAADSFVRVAETSGWDVAFSPDLLPYGATTLPIERRVARAETRRARDCLAILRQSTEVPFLSLFDTVAFRLSPFIFKGPLLYSRIRHAVKGRRSAAGFWGEPTLYAELAARPVSAGNRPFLGFFHSWGVHPPWTAGFATLVTDKFAALARLFDAYRAAGIYANALIVVTSDHGLDEAPAPTGYPPSASAFLMVKPAGADAPLTVSDAQTSHARIAPLVKAALAGRVDASACDRILRDDRPLFRAEVREGAREFFRDWPAKGSEEKK